MDSALRQLLKANENYHKGQLVAYAYRRIVKDLMMDLTETELKDFATIVHMGQRVRDGS